MILNKSIFPLDETLTVTTTFGQSGPGSNGNKAILNNKYKLFGERDETVNSIYESSKFSQVQLSKTIMSSNRCNFHYSSKKTNVERSEKNLM